MWSRRVFISCRNDCSRSFSRFISFKSSSTLSCNSEISCDLCLIETQRMQIGTSHFLQYAEHLFSGCESHKHTSSSSLLAWSTTSWPNLDLTRRWTGTQESQRLTPQRRQKKETGFWQSPHSTASWPWDVTCDAIIRNLDKLFKCKINNIYIHCRSNG